MFSGVKVPSDSVQFMNRARLHLRSDRAVPPRPGAVRGRRRVQGAVHWLAER
jgi:hypothetical protein